jgi:minor curlin subunit
MKIKFNLILFILIGLFTGNAGAQVMDIKTIDELITFDIIENGTVLNANQAFVQQTGNYNTALSIQQQEGTFSNRNILNQNGAGNNAYMEQIGEGHIARIIQTGDNNEVNSWSVGQFVNVAIEQNGGNNIVNSYIDNKSSMPKEAMLQQYGNNNKIDIALLGDGFSSESLEKTATITQTGNDHVVTAILDTYASPIIIEQKAGPSGEGMKVNISNSSFNFPMK